jgi:Tfp pilus assembly protein PilV
MTRTTSRRAVTLVEVLIAIFLMGIGLMAILSLFPLGSVQMAQAIQDQRAAEAATTAAAFARVMWKQACAADPNDAQMKFLNVDGVPQPAPQQPFVLAMDDPNANMPSSVKISSMQPIQRTASVAKNGTVAPAGPSYPVIVDPIGWQANVNQSAQAWVGYTPTAPQTWCIPRRPLFVQQPGPNSTTWVSMNSMGTLPMFKAFSLMDDMTFDFNGTPKNSVASPTVPVERQGRYSWAFMFRRANNADRTAVDITTILYSGRSIDVASLETAYAGTITFPTVAPGVAPMTKSLTLAYSSQKPALRRGGWILDATLADANGLPDPQGIFYRVVNVDDSTPGALVVELQTPIVGRSTSTLPQTTQRTIVVLEKVVEVFTKKDVSSVAPPMPY